MPSRHESPNTNPVAEDADNTPDDAREATATTGTNTSAGDKPAAETDQAAAEGATVDGTTTRDDALDSGAPMLPGSGDEPVGPEDALGSGPKRGDYSGLIGVGQFSASVPNPNHDPSDPSSPRSVLVAQNPLVEQRGDEEGVKGGTHPLSEEVSS